MRKGLIAFLLVSTMFAVPVLAAVSYAPDTGGFVGKGDVQTLFGWNNATLQKNASLIQFRYSDNVVVEEGPCLNPNTGAEHPNDVWERTTGLRSAVAYDPRVKNQITGFNLSSVSGSGTPTYTDQCGGNRIPGAGQIVDVIPGDGLEVLNPLTNQWHLLPNTP